ncbi:MAG: LON peptidase substrate-binding domain-containing protein, partial [Bradyrhizobium sp.]
MASVNEQDIPAIKPSSDAARIPEDALIIVPVRDIVLFPGAVAPITIARPKSVAAAQQALREQRPIGILLQRNPDANDPGPDDLYRVCTVANIIRYITAPDESHHVICQGVQRARVLDFLPGTPF